MPSTPKAMSFKQAATLGLFFFCASTPTPVLAWGKRGHQIVAEAAVALVAGEPSGEFLADRGFDFSYYNLVPDFIWKRPEFYQRERPEHFMNLEVFDRAFSKRPITENPFSLSRKEFERRYPEVPQTAGRAYWRVREMVDRLAALTQRLKALGPAAREARRKLQGEWLVLAGTLGHYVADLGQPMHLSENYDGQLTGQKGLHAYFETTLVNELFPNLLVDVMEQAKKEWPEFKKTRADDSILALVEKLGKDSLADLPRLLAIDKKRPRNDLKANAVDQRSLIHDGLVRASLVLAEIYRRQLGWMFDDKDYYFFAGEPPFLAP